MLEKSYIIENEAALRQAITDEALRWLGAKYHINGMLDYKACDCCTILIKVFSKVGLIDEIEPPQYYQDFMLHRGEDNYLSGIAKHGHKVKSAKRGDILLYQFGRVISHSAIVISDDLEIVHAVAGQGVILDDSRQERLLKRQKFIYSFWSE